MKEHILEKKESRLEGGGSKALRAALFNYNGKS